MGLEHFRADLFQDGFLPPNGYADPLVGPFISQMLATGQSITQALETTISFPEQSHRHFLPNTNYSGVCLW